MTEHATSKDGTEIAYDKVGDGPALILLGGPPTADRTAVGDVVAALSEHFTVFNYDRRGRGESGDTLPYSVDREYEDLAAMIDAAGGAAYAYGTSAGANMALEASTRGLNLTRLVLWEPPFIIGDSRPRPPADFAEQLEGLLAEDRRGDMVERFFTEMIGMPAEFVAGMRQAPFWAGMEAGAHTLIRDTRLFGGFALPESGLEDIDVPALVVDGGGAAWPWVQLSATTVAGLVPTAERRTIEGQPHNVATEAIVPVIVEFLR